MSTTLTVGSSMNDYEAVPTEWRELLRGSYTNISIQNQGIGKLFVRIATTVPADIEESAWWIGQGEREVFWSLAAGQRVFLRSEQQSVKFVHWG